MFTVEERRRAMPAMLRAKSQERVVILGAGAAGLLAALMLAGENRAIIILERDPSPLPGLAR